MNDFYNFTNLGCWQQAKELAVEMYRISTDGNLKDDITMRNQLRESAISVVSNIAEGKEIGVDSEFIKFLVMAKTSAAGLRTRLIISRDLGYLAEGDFLDLEDKLIRILAMIGGLIRSIKKKADAKADTRADSKTDVKANVKDIKDDAKADAEETQGVQDIPQ